MQCVKSASVCAAESVMRSRAEPIYFMRFVGSTRAMEQSMNERMLNFHDFAVDIDVKG